MSATKLFKEDSSASTKLINNKKRVIQYGFLKKYKKTLKLPKRNNPTVPGKTINYLDIGNGPFINCSITCTDNSFCVFILKKQIELNSLIEFSRLNKKYYITINEKPKKLVYKGGKLVSNKIIRCYNCDKWCIGKKYCKKCQK